MNIKIKINEYVRMVKSLSKEWNKSSFFIEFPGDIKILDGKNNIIYYLVDVFGR